MKIIYFHDNFPPEKYGGAASMCFSMAESFQNAGNDVVVVTTTRDKTDEGGVSYKGIKVYKIYSDYHQRWRSYLSLYNPQTVNKLDTILKTEKPDVVHAHNVHYYLSYFSLRLAKKYAKKVFLSVHDVMLVSNGKAYPKNPNATIGEKIQYNISFLDQLKNNKLRFNPFRNFFIHYFLRSVDKIFAVSEALKEVLEMGGIKNIEVVHNGMDPLGWDIASDEITVFKKENSLQDKKILLLSGRISNAKGGRQILKCLSILIDEFPEIILVVLGKKDVYIEKLSKENSLKNISAHIYYPGWVEGGRLKLFYLISDVVVVPSVCFDSFPNVNLEAMLAHKPVVATCFGGSKESVIDGQTGFIVNPNDIGTFTEKIRTLVGDKNLSITFGERGYRRVIEEFSLSKQVKKIEYWYATSQ